jgi:hypothetical protein
MVTVSGPALGVVVVAGGGAAAAVDLLSVSTCDAARFALIADKDI